VIGHARRCAGFRTKSEPLTERPTVSTALSRGVANGGELGAVELRSALLVLSPAIRSNSR
jgi:hypothetical protein